MVYLFVYLVQARLYVWEQINYVIKVLAVFLILFISNLYLPSVPRKSLEAVMTSVVHAESLYNKCLSFTD